MDVQPELMTEKKLGIIIVDKDSRNKKILWHNQILFEQFTFIFSLSWG